MSFKAPGAAVVLIVPMWLASPMSGQVDAYAVRVGVCFVHVHSETAAQLYEHSPGKSSTVHCVFVDSNDQQMCDSCATIDTWSYTWWKMCENDQDHYPLNYWNYPRGNFTVCHGNSRFKQMLNPFPLLLNVPHILKTRVHLQFWKICGWPIWLLIDPL